MKVMAGIDLHSNNAMIALVNEQGQRLGHKKVPCHIESVEKFLQPHREQLSGIAVESTFNWYWLVDGLQERGYPVVLANPAGMMQYSGLKHADDKSDAYHLANLLRLEILPTGHIYDRELRPVRDLLRRRVNLVQHRTALLLSLKSLHHRVTGNPLSRSQAAALTVQSAEKLFDHSTDQFVAREQIQLVGSYNQSISRIEKAVMEKTRHLPNYQPVIELPGVGRILGLTITLETGPIDRFKTAGDYASYSRCVNAGRYSNGKSKGENNSKCGNKYLAWAFVEAAQYARRYYPECRAFYDRKEAKSNAAVATKALACKLSKAAWHMMRLGSAFDMKRMFPGARNEAMGAEKDPHPTSLTSLGNVS